MGLEFRLLCLLPMLLLQLRLRLRLRLLLLLLRLRLLLGRLLLLLLLLLRLLLLLLRLRLLLLRLRRLSFPAAPGATSLRLSVPTSPLPTFVTPSSRNSPSSSASTTSPALSLSRRASRDPRSSPFRDLAPLASPASRFCSPLSASPARGRVRLGFRDRASCASKWLRSIPARAISRAYGPRPGTVLVPAPPSTPAAPAVSCNRAAFTSWQ